MLEKFKDGFGFIVGGVVGFSAVKWLMKEVKVLDEKEAIAEWLKENDPDLYEQAKTKLNIK